jgi:type IV secretory pathway VirB10-like protein
LRSDVDSHYLERWGGLVAASFLEGFAEAVSNSGLSTQDTDVGVVVDQPRYSTSDQLWIAAGKVGENLAQPMLQNFYRPPTVYLEPGTEIGILIVKN